MARIRTVKPRFFKHFGLYKLEQKTKLPIRLGFEGLWIVADREGRFLWEPEEIKADAMPHDRVDFSKIMDALEEGGFIVKYVVNGKTYGHIPSWHEHQVINNKEAKSVIPFPPNDLTRELRVPHACPTPLSNSEGEKEEEKEGKGREGVASDDATIEDISNFAEKIYQQYPRKVGKQDAIKEIVRAMEREKPRGGYREAAKFLYLQTQKYARSPSAKELKYVPHPDKWFKKERYNDESDWSLASGTHQPDRAEQRQQRTIETNLEVLRRIGHSDFVDSLVGRGELSPVDDPGRKDDVVGKVVTIQG